MKAWELSVNAFLTHYRGGQVVQPLQASDGGESDKRAPEPIQPSKHAKAVACSRVFGWGVTFGAQSERRRRWNAQLCNVPQSAEEIAEATDTARFMADLRAHLRFWSNPENYRPQGMTIPLMECDQNGMPGTGYYRLPDNLRPRVLPVTSRPFEPL